MRISSLYYLLIDFIGWLSRPHKKFPLRPDLKPHSRQPATDIWSRVNRGLRQDLRDAQVETQQITKHIAQFGSSPLLRRSLRDSQSLERDVRKSLRDHARHYTSNHVS